VGSKWNPWEYIHSGNVALPAVLPKVHLHPESLYVPTEVKTLQVDGLALIPGLTQAPYRRILSHWIAVRNPPRLIPLSTNTQGSLMPWVSICFGFCFPPSVRKLCSEILSKLFLSRPTAIVQLPSSNCHHPTAIVRWKLAQGWLPAAFWSRTLSLFQRYKFGSYGNKLVNKETNN